MGEDQMLRSRRIRSSRGAAFALSLFLLLSLAADHARPRASAADGPEAAESVAFFDLAEVYAQAPPQSTPQQGTPQQGAQPPQTNPILAALEKQIAGQENKPAEEVFKNIQVMKGVPAGRLLRIMAMGYAPALGVNCAHCHVPGEWEKDDKEAKGTARKMIALTRKLNEDLRAAINKGAVNCYTCHRGQTKPALNPGQPPAATR
jgi:hypothetical protein